MFNPMIIVAIIIQYVVAKSSRKAGAIVGFVITIGILLWGISVYGEGGEIELFGISLSEPIFYIACLVWFGFDTMEFLAAQKRATETGTSSTTITKTQIPAIALFLLWITTNVFANIGWTMLYPLFIPLSPTIANIVIQLSSGMIAGLLQWLLLIMIIPKANRWFLALWIPATMLGWAIISIIIAFVAIPSGMSILVSVIRGGTIGVLQWLVLQKYSKVALWLIPANIIDIVAASLLPRFIFENINIPNMTIGNIVVGVIGSIATSIAIVFISKKALSVSNLETENIAESV
jgi:hypothetical protein